MAIADTSGFITACHIITSATYKGDKYCHLITAERTILFWNAFMEQETFTAEVALHVIFRNPLDNFKTDTSKMSAAAKEKHYYDTSFHVSTVTFDLANSKAFANVVTRGYQQADIQNWITTMKQKRLSEMRSKYFRGVD